MQPQPTTNRPRTIKEIALFDLEAAKRKKEQASRQHDLEAAKKTLPVQELDRTIYGRCATTKANVVFNMADGSEIEGRVLASSRFCVTVELEGSSVERRLIYKHAIVSVAYPVSERPIPQGDPIVIEGENLPC